MNHSYKQHCNNCGRFGHINKACKEPITSIGIICVRIDDEQTRRLVRERLFKLEKASIPKLNSLNNRIIPRMEDYNDKIRFLMIKRKHSLGFLEFIRGRYEIDDYQKIIKLFEHMSHEEIDIIKMRDFDFIWNQVWGRTAHLKIYEEEYKKSREKFNSIKFKNELHNVIGLDFFTNNITPKWKQGEWGFPKGRRSYHEKNVSCAIREFQEETGYTNDDCTLFENVLPTREIFRGTNGVEYKHIYYLALLNDNIEIPKIAADNNEVGDIQWYTYSEGAKVIRSYHTEKKQVLNDVFKFLVYLAEEDVQEK